MFTEGATVFLEKIKRAPTALGPCGKDAHRREDSESYTDVSVCAPSGELWSVQVSNII